MNKMKLLAASVLAGVFMTTSVVSVAETGAVGSAPNPFSDCGIGAALFSDTTWAAVSSNIIWDIGTTAVTSATASPETCQNNKVETAQFIIDNYDNLAEETAQGSGQHLTAMLNVLGCKAESQVSIISSVRADMSELVGQVDYANLTLVEKASNYYDAVNTAADSCSA